MDTGYIMTNLQFFFRWNHVAICFTGATYGSGGYNWIIQNVRLRLELILQLCYKGLPLLSHNVLVICHWIIDLNDHGCISALFPASQMYFKNYEKFQALLDDFQEKSVDLGLKNWFAPVDRWLRKSVLTSGSVGNCHFYLRYDRCLRVTTRIWKVNRPVSTCRSRPFLNADAADESGWHIQPFQQCQLGLSENRVYSQL